MIKPSSKFKKYALESLIHGAMASVVGAVAFIGSNVLVLNGVEESSLSYVSENREFKGSRVLSETVSEDATLLCLQTKASRTPVQVSVQGNEAKAMWSECE